MKMTRDDIRALKDKHRLENIMQETGEVFEIDSKHADQLRSTNTPGLTVDIHRQIFEIKLPGKDESGDVIAWLKRRYSWTFGMAIKFLQKRPGDSSRKASIKSIKKKQAKINLTSEWKIEKLIYTDPVTGRNSYAATYNYELMDELQKRALKIADDWILDYFSMSSSEIFGQIKDFPYRFKKVVDFSFEECARCGATFDWSDPGTFCYTCEETEYLEIVSDNSEIKNAYVEQPVFIDSDFSICEKCLREKYAPRYKALNLVYRSACKREEAWIDEEREKEIENAIRDNGAGGERSELL